MRQEEIEAIFLEELSEADSYNGSELTENRRMAMKYYCGQPRGDEVVGRSSVQSLDVADQVNAVWAQVQRAFAGIVVDFPPNGEQDEAQAQAEGDFVQHQLDKSNAWRVLNLAVFDALLKRNGWLKVWVDESTSSTTDTYPTTDLAALGMALQPQDGSDEVLEVMREGDGEIEIKRTVTKRVLRFKSVDPAKMRFSSEADNPDLSDMRFVSEEEYFTRTELVEMGYPKAQVWELQAEQQNDEDEGSAPMPEPAEAAQKGAQTIRCQHCYLELATATDSTTELYYGFVAAEHLLKYEPVELRPYVTGSALPMPHRVSGQSFYDLLKQVQDSKTFTLRQWMDNLNIANNTRLVVVRGEVDMDSALNSRPGGVIIAESEGAVTPILSPDVGPSCQAALDYQDNIRTERGGAALDLMRGEMQVAASSALAAANEFSSKEQMSEFYTANLIYSLVRGVFLLTHATMRLYMPGQMQMKRRGKWEASDPSQWVERSTVKIVAGLSMSDKRERVTGLTQVIQQQMGLIAAGGDGIITDYGKLYAAMADWIRTYDLGDPSEYLIDPDGQDAQQTMAQRSQAAQQKEAQAAQMAEMERSFERYKHDTDLQFKYFDARLDAEMNEAKLTVEAMNDAEQNAIKTVQLGEKDNGPDQKGSTEDSG